MGLIKFCLIAVITLQVGALMWGFTVLGHFRKIFIVNCYRFGQRPKGANSLCFYTQWNFFLLFFLHPSTLHSGAASFTTGRRPSLWAQDSWTKSPRLSGQDPHLGPRTLPWGPGPSLHSGLKTLIGGPGLSLEAQDPHMRLRTSI